MFEIKLIDDNNKRFGEAENDRRTDEALVRTSGYKPGQFLAELRAAEHDGGCDRMGPKITVQAPPAGPAEGAEEPDEHTLAELQRHGLTADDWRAMRAADSPGSALTLAEPERVQHSATGSNHRGLEAELQRHGLTLADFAAAHRAGFA